MNKTNDNETRVVKEEILNDAHSRFECGLNKHANYKINDTMLCTVLVQETFIRTWIYMVKGGKIITMKAFLYRILNNLIIDEYRKNKSTSLDVLIERGFEPSTDESIRLFDILDGKMIMILIKKLPGIYREVIRMRYLQELSITEIATITGQSRNTVAVQSYRGLEKLKLLYEARII